MNIDFTPEDEAFRDEVRGFIAANLPRECADSPALGVMTDKSVVKRWHPPSMLSRLSEPTCKQGQVLPAGANQKMSWQLLF